MFDIDSVRVISLIKQSERQKVLLVEGSNGKKYLKREISGDKREIYKALQKINHTNIPKIHYVGFDSDTIIIEEYIEGISLSDFMEQNKKLSKKQICSISKQILSALDKLHELDIIHRDIKPDNILIDKSNHIWLTDYDIARIYRKEVRRDTETIGTFGYAPIEQYGMLPTDFKTDIYAFGATLKSLLDYSGIKGFLYKVTEKCKRLDPAERYANVSAVKRALQISKIIPLLIVIFLAIAITFGIAFFALDSNKIEENLEMVTEQAPEKGKTEDNIVDEISEIMRFLDFQLPQEQLKYSRLKNYNTTAIFSGEGLWHYLPVMEDMQSNGIILLGKNHKTEIEADVKLKDGVFSISLTDEFGRSFSKEFYFDGKYDFEVLYPDNRRINAELVCRDLDGDDVEELLIGLCDCSLTITDTSIFQYFNYSIGWILRYDEARGFILCEGDMFSENSKLVLVENDLRVHLPYAAANTDDKDGYKLENNKIVTFFEK